MGAPDWARSNRNLPCVLTCRAWVEGRFLGERWAHHNPGVGDMGPEEWRGL